MLLLLHDLNDAARELWKAPLFALVAFAILAAGIGLNVAASSVIDPTSEPEPGASISQDSD